MTRAVAKVDAPIGPVAYVMTHYPRVALTYITGEIDALEARGLTIVPFAINAPGAEDLATDAMRARSARTFYLKRNLARAAGAFAERFMRHPLTMLGMLRLAIGSAGWDLNLMARRLAHLVEASLLARECERRGVRHLHAHFGQAPATLAWFASEMLRRRRQGGPAWSFTIHGFQDFVDNAIARLDLKAASARFVVCVSDFTRSQLCRVTPSALWHRFEVVRCGIDIDRFAFRVAEPQAGTVEIVAVGRLSPEKGFSILLRALAAMRDRGVAARLTLIGEGPARQEIDRDIAGLGLSDDVTLTGELSPDEVIDRLRQATIFCLPSFSEGLPISIMEAMATGVPVVATHIAGIPELAVDGVTALTVPAGNVERLADALSRLAGDPALRKSLAKAARAEVEKRHDRDRSAEQMLALYRSKALAQ